MVPYPSRAFVFPYRSPTIPLPLPCNKMIFFIIFTHITLIILFILYICTATDSRRICV